jgi:hypothetical protein
MAVGKANKDARPVRNITRGASKACASTVPVKVLAALQLKGAFMKRALANASSSEAVLRKRLFEETKRMRAYREAAVDVQGRYAELLTANAHVRNRVLAVACTTPDAPSRFELIEIVRVMGTPSEADTLDWLSSDSDDHSPGDG